MIHEVSTYLRMFSTSRRHFLKATTIAGSLTAAATLTPGSIAGIALSSAAAQGGGDLDILNYALTLEHFENAMYRALTGSGTLLTGQALDYARTYGSQENDHVVALTDTITKLGGTPVKEQASYNFPRVSSEAEVIQLITTVEDVGASAYLGAAPLIQSADLLTVAVQIHTVEAEHATAFRFLSGQDPVPFAFAPPRTIQEVLDIVTPFLAPPMASMPNTGMDSNDTLRVVGVAGGIAALAAGVALTRSSKPQSTESE